MLEYGDNRWVTPHTGHPEIFPDVLGRPIDARSQLLNTNLCSTKRMNTAGPHRHPTSVIFQVSHFHPTAKSSVDSSLLFFPENAHSASMNPPSDGIREYVSDVILQAPGPMPLLSTSVSASQHPTPWVKSLLLQAETPSRILFGVNTRFTVRVSSAQIPCVRSSFHPGPAGVTPAGPGAKSTMGYRSCQTSVAQC